MSAATGVRTWWRGVKPERRNLGRDAVAAIPCAVSAVPDGMATSVLAGVSPIHGLFATFAGPIAGGLSSSTQLVMITTTSAAALAAGSALQNVDSATRTDALLLLTVLAGVAMVVAGALRLGRYTRFVSHSVMMGFLAGVALNIIMGQLMDLCGASVSGETALRKALQLITHPSRIELASLATGLAAIAILALLGRVKGFIGNVSALVALIVPSVLVALTGADSVERVSDLGEIPSGVPVPHLPDLSALSLPVITGALAVAAIVLVQGAGVSESVPNPDGSPTNPGQDFVAQGVGNLASGLFKGQPVGASVGETALNVSAGAVTRWASIFAGCWMLVVLVAFSDVVGKVAVPTLAAVLIVAALHSLRIAELVTVWRTSWTSRVAIGTTFIATLLMPIQFAVAIGVALSALLQLNREAMDVALVRIVRRADGKFEERPPPETLKSHAVTLLEAYGSLFFAGARTFETRLPDPTGSERAAVVLRLRGRTSLGATFYRVIRHYATRLSATGGRLYLSGVDAHVAEQFRRTGVLDGHENIAIFPATPVVFDSTRQAMTAARAWIENGGGTAAE